VRAFPRWSLPCWADRAILPSDLPTSAHWRYKEAHDRRRSVSPPADDVTNVALWMMDFVIQASRGLSLLALATAILLLFRLLNRRNSPYPLPPGPPGRFLVGNLGQVSHENPEQDYIRWGRQYSESATSSATVTGNICH
jgi:hypothetical protein